MRYATIGFSIVMILLILMATWDISARNSLDRRSDRQEASSQFQRTQDRIAAICIDSTSRAKCVAEIEDAAEYANQTQQGLEVQQDMALWAKLTFLATAAGVVATLYGFLWVRKGIKANTDAVREAAHANTIALEQNRAWISVKARALSDIVLSGTSTTPSFEIELENLGPSPAKDFLVIFSFVKSTDAITNKASFEKFAADHLASHHNQAVRARTLLAKGVYVEHFDRKLAVEVGRPFWYVLFVSVVYRINGTDRLHQSAFMFDLLFADAQGMPRLIHAKPDMTLKAKNTVFKVGIGGIVT